MLKRRSRISRSLFAEVLKTGARCSGKFFLVRYKTLENKGENGEKDNKFAAVVSKKVASKAVVRNKIRRRIYGAVDELTKKATKLKNTAIIFFVNKSSVQANYKDLLLEIEEVLKKIGYH